MTDFIIKPKKAIKTDKIALIDADFIGYKLPKDLTRQQLHTAVEDEIQTLRECFQAKGMIFCFSGDPKQYFRNFVSFEKKYKGNRERSEKSNRNEIVRYIKQRYVTLQFIDLEADDILAMLQDQDTFIYSEDKDLLQVSGTHWDIKSRSFVEITEEQALQLLMKQLVTGDSVDNIVGLKGYGSSRYVELLTNSRRKHIYRTVIEAFILEHGVVEGIDTFVEMWNLVKLRSKRGEHFCMEHQLAFSTLNLVKQS